MKQFIDINSVESLSHSFGFVKSHDYKEETYITLLGAKRVEVPMITVVGFIDRDQFLEVKNKILESNSKYLKSSFLWQYIMTVK